MTLRLGHTRANAPKRAMGAVLLRTARFTALLCWAVVGLTAYQSALAEPIVTKADVKAAQDVLKAIDHNRFKDALHLTHKVKNPDVVRVLMWRYITHHRSPAKFDDVKAFLRHQSGWPSQKAMLKRAEETMPIDMTANEVVGWFKALGPPVSPAGKARLGEALLDLGVTDRATAYLRAAWVDGNFTKRDEGLFYKRHKKILRPEDHIARLDRLIWQEKFWPARRQIWKVDEKTRLVGVARIWLMRREGNVDKAIGDIEKNAPDMINDPGLVYERMRWRRRKGRYDDAAALFKSVSGDPGRPDKWWVERAIVARTYLQNDKAKDAYAIVSAHGLTTDDAAEYAEAEWLSGWIALRFLKDPKRALEHFTHMHSVVNFPISVARGAYWSGRAAHDLGRNADATSWFKKAAQHPSTYYGQLARAHLGLEDVTPPNPSPPKPLKALVDAFNTHPMTRAALILAELDEHDLMRPVLNTLSDANSDPAWQAMTARFAADHGRPDMAIRLAKESSREGVILGDLGYPAVDLPMPGPHKNGGGVEAPLVLSIIRQESEFYVRAQSHVGARGLMQVMPATAKVVARQNRLPYDRDRLKIDPQYNLVIGQVYLADVINQFEGSYPMALAAYNAGPHRVKRWLKTYGDPRKGEIDMIDWVESIPFSETRNYVQRVMENLAVYRVRLKSQKIAQGN